MAIERLLQSPLGNLLMRPWFDRVGVPVVTRVYFPLSNIWAIASRAEGSLGRFYELLGARPKMPGLEAALTRTANLGRAYRTAATHWEKSFFAAKAPDNRTLAEAERRRVRAAQSWMSARMLFLPGITAWPSVQWEVPSPGDLLARHGTRLKGGLAAYPAPTKLEPEQSHAYSESGVRTYWLRYPSPVMGDTAWARVSEPADREPAGTVLFLHGIGMETEMWRRTAQLVNVMQSRGFRTIAPEGPWHGRRRMPGRSGGGPVIGRGPEGFLMFMQAMIAETGALIGWARGLDDGPVGLSGTSLGALTAQKLVDAARHWPAEYCPDALCLLSTTGDLLGVLNAGSMSRDLGVDEQFQQAGWDDDALKTWLPLLEPEAPCMAPEKIVLVLGMVDDLTPYPGGKDLAKRWGVPEENVFDSEHGHFSASLNVLRDPRPLDRFAAILKG